MSEVNFSKETAGKVNVSGDAPAILSDYMRDDEKKYPVGTVGSDIRAMLKAVEQKKRDKLKMPQEFGNLNAIVNTYEIYGGDFNGDGNKDILLLRTANIPDGDKKSVTSAWLVAILDNGDGKLSSDEEKAGIVIASGMMAGNSSPITNIKIGDFDKDGLSDVSYSKYNEVKKQFNAVTATASKNDLPRSASEDRELLLSALKYYDTVYQAPEEAWVKTFIRKEFKEESDKVEGPKAVAIPNVLRPLYSSIKGAKFDDPRLETLAGIFLRDADQALAVSAADLEARIKMITELTDQFKALEKTFTWKGEKISRPDFEQLFRSEKDEKVRLEMAKWYEAHFSSMYAEGGKYQKFVDSMNEMAVRYGFNNYAEMKIKERFGITLPEFKKWVADTLAATETDAKAYIDELKNFSGAQELGYWDVGYWDEEWVKRSIGVEKMPELNEKEMMTSVKALFKDMGFNMTTPPYKNVVMDIYDDPMKFNVPGTAATATNDTAYFISNIVPGKKIPLNNVETVIHELIHDMHFITAGEKLKGYSIYQNDGYPYVYEGMTMSTEDLPFATPALMKRYFGKIDGVTDEFAKAYGAAKRKSSAWETRKLLAMAMMEVNLYENSASWKDRMSTWGKMVRETLFVEPKGIELGQIMCRAHPYSEQQQLGYASYPLGLATVKRIRDAIIEEGTPEELMRYGNALKKIMAKGGTADQRTLMEVVKEAEENR